MCWQLWCGQCVNCFQMVAWTDMSSWRHSAEHPRLAPWRRTVCCLFLRHSRLSLDPPRPVWYCLYLPLSATGTAELASAAAVTVGPLHFPCWTKTCKPTRFLQCFDTVGLVIWPVKIVPAMTYYVSSGTLNPTHSLKSVLWIVNRSLCFSRSVAVMEFLVNVYSWYSIVRPCRSKSRINIDRSTFCARTTS